MRWVVGGAGLLVAASAALAAYNWSNPTVDPGEPISYRDVWELRDAIERQLATCTPPGTVTWNTGPIQAGLPIRADHLNELRQRARSLLILPSPYNVTGGFTDEPVTTSTPIRATHIIQLRDAINRASCPPPACSCGGWVDGSCNAGGCTDQRQQTRTCAPAGCQAQSQCRPDASCVPSGPVCPGNGCEAGETCDNCPRDCGECGGGGETCGGCTQVCGPDITCYFTEHKTNCGPHPVYGECCDCCVCTPSGVIGSQCCCSGTYHYEIRDDQQVPVCD